MELRNVSRYYPENMPYGKGIQYFRSEDGQDFYESLDKFTKKYKLCIHPETGVIYSMAEDVSRLYPAGFTIVEVDELPEGFGIEASWYYQDGDVLPVPVDYAQLAETQRQRLLNEAKDITSDWKTELELGTISDDDKARLTQWMAYIKAVKALDLSTVTDEASFYSINWPERPDAAA
ncbi:tail fiber assembly protein [Escherichia coli]|uniref:tail fiber assembly protein n=1 Tax=Escherichia coli TaxID=562 RepID=UPI000BE39BB0|nr:tail fiber assembly protein [Escherichia coli]EFB2279009.1 tail fiber assembly protein [Escherichia coli]EFM6583391.1 tail fiber assembly protein [Escherichia coli]EFM6588290.1 tail fiber assembly protein [Escherichia coli]EHH8683268.1 tail fiber assembly protein [Escherichia coli]EHI1112403.1 tail fiber assembly protein [Escherichia coli]